MGVQKFGFKTTAMQAIAGRDLTGKVAVVTGGNSGIGLETVRALSYAGCNVVLCCRNTEAGQQAADDVKASFPENKGTLSVEQLDLNDLGSVKDCADRINKSYEKVNILILNAGVIARTLTRTKQGLEQHFGVNYVGHHYLTNLLLPKMKESSVTEEGRIIAVSSIAHHLGKIDMKDLNFDERKYSGFSAYGQSKLAAILMCRYLADRFENEGVNIKAFSLHPGAIATKLQDDTRYVKFLFKMFSFLCKTPDEGASTTIYACTEDNLPSGSYLSHCKTAMMSRSAKDMAMAEQLWETTNQLIQAKMDA